MNSNGRRVVIIGAGIAGLSAAVYALKCGYRVEILEMHDMTGGLAMSWRRGNYTFETCLHWLVGSKPGADFHSHWQELCDVDQLKIVDAEEFVRIETEGGDRLSMFTNVDRLEEELLRRAPQDGEAIRDLTHAIRALGKFRMPDPSGSFGDNWLNLLRDVPVFPLLRRLSKVSGAEYGSRFSDPLLRRFFSEGDIGAMSAVAMVISLAFMNAGNAGYCIGGSQALIRLIEEKIAKLGGTIRFNARVEKILVDRDTAVGVQLSDGEVIESDWVISAADGHSTIFEMLGGKYADNEIRRRYDEKKLFSSYLQVSLGVGRDLSSEPPMLARVLKAPLMVDPGTETDHVGFRIFHFDPSFAPAGKTAVTSLLLTRNFSYWADLRRNDPRAYHAEKHRIAEAVITVLDRRIPGVRDAIETVDVSTPATVMRYTGNWKGTMEGWLVEPNEGFKPLPNTLPGLSRFMMVGQWVMPGGGLPSGPMSARPAVKAMCKQDHLAFNLSEEHAREPVAV